MRTLYFCWSSFRLRPVSLLLGLFLFSFHAQAQAPANDDPCGAVVLTPQGGLCTMPVVGTNRGATTTAPNGYANPGTCGGNFTGSGPEDVWYRFTTAATGLGSTGATVTVSGNPAGQLRLFSAASCAGPFTELGCVASTARNTSAPPLTTTALRPNTTYYVRVAGYDGFTVAGPFTICLTDGPGFVPCQNPVLGLPAYAAGNTAATFAFAPAPNNVGPYTATLQRLASLPPFPPAVVFATTPPSVAVTGLVPGEGYSLTVQGTCSSGGSVTAIQNFTVPVLNDEPCGALVLAVDPGTGCVPLDGAVTGATLTPPNGYANPGCAAPGPAPTNDVWYRFTTPAAGPGSTALVLTLSNVDAVDELRLFAAPSCAGPFTQLACSATTPAASGAPPIAATGLVPNTTYYVLVAGRLTSTGSRFRLCASAQPPVLPCTAPDALFVSPDFLTPTTAIVGISLALGSAPPVSYAVTYTPAGGPAQTVVVPYSGGAIGTTGAVLTGLLPNTAYTVSVVANCAGGAQSPAVGSAFTTPPAASTPPPANDDCAGATPLPVATTCVPVTATNLNATFSLVSPQPLCSNLAGADVWFSVVVPANGIVQVASGPVSGSVVTAVALQLLTGTCGNLVQVACGGGVGVAYAQVRGTGLVPGSTAYVRAWRPNSAVGGPFTVCATTDVTCPLATNLTATALTPTSATLTFALPAGNTGYVLTYQAAGGTAQTQAVTASPVVLTGLTPGTAYAVALTGSCPGSAAGTVRTAFTTPVVPSCAAPGAVYTGNLTATSVGIGFVTSTAASSYAVTYQAAGGPVQTVTPAPSASPVTLSGLVPGTAYTVCVSSSCTNGLSSAPVCATVFSTPLAARNAALAAQLTLSPNPAHHSATLTVPAALLRQAGLLTLSDALGRTVRQRYVTPTGGTAAETRAELDLTGLPTGVYLVRLLSSAGPLTKRLVIE